MLVVRVELHSAITGQTTEIARALIYNDGSGNVRRGDYITMAFKGRDGEAWTREQIRKGMENPMRKGEVKNYPRFTLHVWNLVARALKSMGYS